MGKTAEEIAENFVAQFGFTPRSSVAMAESLESEIEAYHQSRLSELREKVDSVEESKLLKEIYENNDYLRGVNEGHQKAIEHVLNLIEQMQE